MFCASMRVIMFFYRGARLKVFLIVTATLVTGLGASFLLLKCGVRAMWLRYSLSALFAYAAFFLYMRILIY
jgi:hypothetical protein